MAFLKGHPRRALVARALLLAAWWAVYTFVIRPLLPDGDIVGVVIIIVLSLGILAVPIVAACRRR
ncbi:hypothetical protein [Amycolatopsis sp. cg13]|uniref:hypothetical protein n=1 Tax=Amycolatopsis sp. cg13 TaxID=3238807 RepID=UPI003523E561